MLPGGLINNCLCVCGAGGTEEQLSVFDVNCADKQSRMNHWEKSPESWLFT